ncbi:hypothetical protein BGX26_004862, partial [Mortierella sp. AD094]
DLMETTLENRQMSRSWQLKRNGVYSDGASIEKTLIEKFGHPGGLNRWVITMDPVFLNYDSEKYLHRCYRVYVYFAAPVSEEWMEYHFSDKRWWGIKSWDMSDEDMEWLFNPYDD